MTTIFSPVSTLEQHVHAGDRDACVALLRALPAAARAAHRASVLRMLKMLSDSAWHSEPRAGIVVWGTHSNEEQWRAAGACLIMCGTCADLARHWAHVEDLIVLCPEYQPGSLTVLAEGMLAEGPHGIDEVQRLVEAGAIERPGGDNYVVGLIHLPRARRRNTLDYFTTDPGLASAVLRIFDIEGHADCCLAGVDKYLAFGKREEHSWRRTLLTLCAQGAFSRAALLDKTLGALERDWPQFRSSWFLQFHGALAPTLAELAVNGERYLRLCQSRIAPTVTLALGVLKSLDGAELVAPAALLQALPPVLAAGSKGQVESALKLLERVATRQPSLRQEVALAACAALFHESPALQKAILGRLDGWQVDQAVRTAMAPYLDGMAASNRGEFLRLCGAAPEPEPAPAPLHRTAPQVLDQRTAVLDASLAMAPLTGVDDLVQHIAYVLEHDDDIDAFERAIQALVQAAPLSGAALAALAPVIKRAAAVRTPVACELARLLRFVAHAAPVTQQFEYLHPAHLLLLARIDYLKALAATGKRLSPLSSPSHRHGYIAPSCLIDRVRQFQENDVHTSTAECALALLRLAPCASADDLAQARALVDTPFARALRYALGDAISGEIASDIANARSPELYAAAARIRWPGADDATLAAAQPGLGADAACVARFAWRVFSHTSCGPSGKLIYHYHYIEVDVIPARGVGDMLLAVQRHQAPYSITELCAYSSSWRFCGKDATLIGYFATLLPSDLETFFAEGARAFGDNLDWHTPMWQNKAYLEPLLLPTVRCGPMATLMLALALAGKEPGQTALATDCLVRTWADGRLDVALLTHTMQQLLQTPMPKAARYRKSLEAALRIEPALADTLIDLLSACVVAAPAQPPKDVALLLELLHELLIGRARTLSEHTRGILGTMTLSGKGKPLLAALLARQ